MKLFVTAGFGQLLTPFWISRARKIAHGVRQEIPSGFYAETIHRIAGEIADSGLDAIFLVNGWLWGNPDGTGVHKDAGRKPTPGHCFDVTGEILWAWERSDNPNKGQLMLEVGPEINIDPVYKRDVEQLLECVHAVASATDVAKSQVPVIAGSVSNVRPDDGVLHLNMWVRRLKAKYWVGVHPYRTTAQPEHFEGYDSQRDMALELKQILSDRPFAITESGWHDSLQKSGGFLCKKESRFSREEVADFAQRDAEIWRELGAELYSWYQIRDGDSSDPTTQTATRNPSPKHSRS